MQARKRELHFNLIDDDSLREKLLRLKGHYAHAQPNMTLTDLLHRLCDEKLEDINRLKSPSAPGTRRKTGTTTAVFGSPITSEPTATSRPPVTSRPPGTSGSRVAAGSRVTRGPQPASQAEIRRQVWRRDEGRCSNCGSTFALEVDHVLPRAAGGPSTLENTRLLCRGCNQRAAIEYFGLSKMTGHLEKSP